MALNLNNIWVEKYRPHKFSDMILSEKNKQLFNSFEHKHDIPHLLFCSKPGMGKTTAAKIIVNDVLKCQYKYINASDTNGIDTVRNEITNFAQTKSWDGNFKVIILDEFDGFTNNAQKALRNIMEEYAKYVRFILTANNKNNVITAIQSRCVQINFDFDITDVYKRCLYIIQNESINFDINDKIQIENLGKLVKINYPDIRKTINTLQQLCSNGEFIFDDKILFNYDFCDNIYKLLYSNDIFKLRTFIIENEQKFNADYNHLLSDFLEYIYKINIDYDKKINIIITITDYLYKNNFVNDLEINTFSCFLTIHKLIKNI